MTMKLIQLVAIFAITSSVLAGCTDLRIDGGGSSGRLECQLNDGQWGTVCNRGFDSNAAKAACRQLGYTGLAEYTPVYADDSWYPSSQLTIAVCFTNCGAYHSFSFCDVTPSTDGSCRNSYCSHYYDILITCHDDFYIDYDDDDDNDNDDESDSDFSSVGTVVGITVGSVSVLGIVVLLVICRVYVRYSYIRRRNTQTYIVTQQRRPRILIARLTRTTTTVPSGPPPPPPYTPTQPTSDYTPVPPRGYQPVATDDYTTTPSSDVPSEPPPEYTPSASTDNAPLVTQNTVQ